MRDLGVTSSLAPLVPDSLVAVIAAITTFGSPTIVAVLGVGGALLGAATDRLDRRTALRFVAVLGLALTASLVLKNGLAFPRPPAALHRVPEDGFGFPSGHVTATSGWTLAAAALSRYGTRRLRYGLASLAIATMAATRVLLGVHYILDVVAGALLGAGAVWVGLRATERHLGATYALVVAGVAVGLFLKAGYSVS